MKIESKTVSVAANPEEVFKYVSNLNNFKNLLPQDRISEWESNDDYCSFKVQGTATIDLHLKNSKEFSELYLESGEKAPFPIKLTVFLSEMENGTKAYQIMEAQINPFLKMMVEKPLANLFDYIADKLVEQFNS